MTPPEVCFGSSGFVFAGSPSEHALRPEMSWGLPNFFTNLFKKSPKEDKVGERERTRIELGLTDPGRAYVAVVGQPFCGKSALITALQGTLGQVAPVAESISVLAAAVPPVLRGPEASTASVSTFHRGPTVDMSESTREACPSSEQRERGCPDSCAAATSRPPSPSAGNAGDSIGCFSGNAVPGEGPVSAMAVVKDIQPTPGVPFADALFFEDQQLFAYDMVVIVYAGRLMSGVHEMLQKCVEGRVPFVVVRNKVDADVQSRVERLGESEEAARAAVRELSLEELSVGGPSPVIVLPSQLYLVSARNMMSESPRASEDERKLVESVRGLKAGSTPAGIPAAGGDSSLP